jgi:hypothetical protein
VEVVGGVHFVWAAILDSLWNNIAFVTALSREQFLEILGVGALHADVMGSLDL